MNSSVRINARSVKINRCGEKLARDERIFLYARGKYPGANSEPFSGHFSEVSGVADRAVFVFRT